MTGPDGIPDGVGRTALFIALARAHESGRPDAWFHDRLAGAFVAAAGGPRAISGREGEPTEDDLRHWRAFADYIAIRTRFLDECLADASSDGCRQVVILGAGLDARAFRLRWPEGTHVFEIDTEPVIGFKESVIASSGVTPRCERTAIVADLRHDWKARLIDAGFRADLPSAWLAEGLLIYLPDDAAGSLILGAARLAAPGSRLALDYVDLTRLAAMKKGAGDDWASRSRFVALWQSGLHEPPADWAARLGWRADATTASECGEAWGRPPGGAAGAPAILLRGARITGVASTS